MGVILDHSPADVMRHLLIQLGAGVLPSTNGTAGGWPIFVATRPDQPDNCITLYDIGSKHDGRLQPTGEVQKHYGIDVVVRGIHDSTTSGYTRVYAKITSICQLLDEVVLRNSITVGSTVYVVWAASQVGTLRLLGPLASESERYIMSNAYLAAITKGSGG